MDWVQLTFYVFSTIATCSALSMISVRNPVYAVLSLIVTIFSVACLWLLTGAEFLGIAMMLVYIGAVMVMFLFVVMMIDMHVAPQSTTKGWVQYLPVGVFVVGVMFFQLMMLVVVHSSHLPPILSIPVDNSTSEPSNLLWLAHVLFTRFLLPFECAAIILTVAVIAAVMLTLRRREGRKTQNPSWQIHANPKERLRLLTIPVEFPHVVEEKATSPQESAEK